MTGLVFFILCASALYLFAKPKRARVFVPAGTADWDYFMAERAAAKAEMGDYT